MKPTSIEDSGGWDGTTKLEKMFLMQLDVYKGRLSADSDRLLPRE